MKNYPKTFAAAKKAEKGQWAIGDALIEEVGATGGSFDACAKELAEAGMPYSTEYLRTLRDIARKFTEGDRQLMPGHQIGVKIALEAGTPAVLRKAEKVAEAEGIPLTKRSVAKVRKADRHAERKAKGRPEMPKPDKTRKTETSVSETRRMARVLDLSSEAMAAAKAGRNILSKLSDADLSAEEREDLIDDVDKVLTTWKAVRDAVKSPIAGEAERYLRSVS